MKKNSAKPLYASIMDDLLRDISAGRFRVGDLIPTENELCERFHVSRITVRRAVSELCDAGILSRRQGKGTFVTRSPKGQGKVPSSVFSFHRLCDGVGKTPKIEVLSSGEEPSDKNTRAALELKNGEKTVKIVRLCYADGVPVAYAEHRFSPAFSFLLGQDLTGSLYEFAVRNGAEAASSYRTIGLVRADETVAKALGIAKDDPLLLVHFVVYDRRGCPMNVTDAYVRGDIFPISFQ